jgi:hypothetical protein
MGSLLWNCFRATCDVKGGTRVRMTADDIRAGFAGAEEFAKQETFTMPDYVVPYDWNVAEIAWELYELDAEQLGLMYDVKEHRMVFPIVHDGKIGYGSFVGVALLGTSLQETHKEYLSQFSTAIIALDPDALPKTLLMAKELRGHVNDVRVLRLKDDLKYRNPTDMENLNGIINH